MLPVPSPDGLIYFELKTDKGTCGITRENLFSCGGGDHDTNQSLFERVRFFFGIIKVFFLLRGKAKAKSPPVDILLYTRRYLIQMTRAENQSSGSLEVESIGHPLPHQPCAASQ